ncbi:MAG: hypothetical protein IPH94_14635 [Saprospiraceae bacterium]|nr:hypothetical protein [Saprospiraceae bacterium]
MVLMLSFIMACSNAEDPKLKQSGQTQYASIRAIDCLGVIPPCPTTNDSTTMYILGCEIRGYFTYALCPGSGFHIYNVSWKMVGANCTNLEQILEDFANHGEYGTIQTIYNGIHANVVKAAENAIFATLDRGEYGCGNDQNPVVFTSNVIAAGCLSICVEYDWEGAPIITEIECGSGCCFRVTEFCFDERGELVIGETLYSSTASCNGPVDCEAQSSPCTLNCGRITRNVLSEQDFIDLTD